LAEVEAAHAAANLAGVWQPSELCSEAIGIDSTTIEAHASVRSIVRKDSGKGWKDYTKKLS